MLQCLLPELTHILQKGIKEGDTFHLVKRVKTFSKSATLGKTKATVKTVADLVFHEKAFDTIDFASDGLRENDKEIIFMMIQEMSEGKNAK